MYIPPSAIHGKLTKKNCFRAIDISVGMRPRQKLHQGQLLQPESGGRMCSWASTALAGALMQAASSIAAWLQPLLGGKVMRTSA